MTCTGFRPSLVFFVIFLSCVRGSSAQETGAPIAADSCAQKAAAMDAALQAYSQRIQQVADSVAPREEDTPQVSGYGTIRWDTRSMDIPEVTLTMRHRDMVYSVPEVTMRRREFSFDVPGFRMERQQFGCTPRTKVEWRGLRPHVTTWCQPNYTNIPVPTLETRRMSTNIPEIAMRPTRTVLSIPEGRVTMKRISWSWPEYVAECTAINSDACRAEERRQLAAAEATQRRVGSAIASAQQQGAQRAAEHVRGFFSCQRDGMQRQYAAMANVYQTTVKQMEAALEMMRVQGADASPEAQETRTALARIRTELPAEMEKLRTAIDELTAQETAIINSLWGSPIPQAE